MNVRWISKYASVAVLALFNLLGQSGPTAPLGPGDAIAVHALHVTEIPQQPIRLGEDGLLELPMIGSIKASGLTPAELAAEIRKRVKSRPVSVLGAVKTPGTYQLDASKRLLDKIAAAGRVDESARFVVSVNRPRVSGPIPVGDAAQISLPDIVDGRRPDDNTVILPNGVTGEVHKSGGFVWRERESIPVLQANAAIRAFRALTMGRRRYFRRTPLAP